MISYRLTEKGRSFAIGVKGMYSDMPEGEVVLTVGELQELLRATDENRRRMTGDEYKFYAGLYSGALDYLSKALVEA